ncbi:STAS domain-containing protein [Aneurinibacillus sp. BA2021]|nr:STAS domain-containing protein [Aneurinibacillus sp. BA2021]
MEFLVIDLSGVHIIDTMVAQQMFKISSALRLIGVTASLSGIRPEVAEAVIRLGFDLFTWT